MSGRTTRRLGVCCRRAWCCTRSSAFRTSWRSSRLTLGEVARAEGNHDGARELLQQSLTLMRNVGERLGVPGTLDAVAHLAMTTGHPQPATGLAAAADQLRATTGTQAWPMPERHRAEWVVMTNVVYAGRLEALEQTWQVCSRASSRPAYTTFVMTTHSARCRSGIGQACVPVVARN